MSGSTSDDPAPLSAPSDWSPLDEPPHADAPALSKNTVRRVTVRGIGEVLVVGGAAPTELAEALLDGLPRPV
jgi:hypothetical protein